MRGDFFDTNIFIYLFDETAPDKCQTAESLIRTSLENNTGIISYQVVQECLNVMTRKLATPVTPTDAQQFLTQLLTPMWRVMPSVALYQRGLDLQQRYRYSFYDAMIIAAALEAGCARLFSEDLQPGQQIEHLTIHNPFAH